MMKHILLFVILSLALLPVVLGVTGTADITFTVPTPVVYDVPFTAVVNLNTNGVAIIDYDLSVGSTDNRISFGAGLTRADTFQFVPGLSGLFSTYYRVRTETNGNTLIGTANNLFTLTNVNIENKIDNDRTQLTLLTTPQRSVTAEPGSTITSVNPVSSSLIQPQLSTCGDGVVGYVDNGADAGPGTANNGRRDGTEPYEACDEGSDASGNKNLASGGCAAFCNYIELGWDCTNKEFGDRLSVCPKIPPKVFLIQKLTALINGQCYPQTFPVCTHPAALYVNTDAAGNPTIPISPRLTYDAQSKLDPSEKIYMIAQIGAALREFFTETIISS